MTDNVVVDEVVLMSLESAANTMSKPLLKQDMTLIEHVHVEAVVEIGRARLTLKDLFNTKAGDVVPLMEDLDHPVGLYVNAKLVAQGILVAVGDKFGVKITQVST